MKRIIFIIDGFNLYYSVREAYHLQKVKYKWLDISSLCKSYLDRYGKKNEIILTDIFYFTALKEHLRIIDPDTVTRHENFIKCLEDTGIKVITNNFKQKEVRCQGTCQEKYIVYEEKETDVAIAVKLLEVLSRDLCDIVVLMTGDTDLRPAYNTAIDLYPDKTVEFAFPFCRKNKSLDGFKIKLARYAANLLPDPYILSDGTEISKPATW